jgi:hypothetical protein
LLTRPLKLAQEGIRVIMKENWALYYHCITDIEHFCLGKEMAVDDVIDKFVVNCGDSDSITEDNSGGGSDTKNVKLFMSDLFPL